MYLAEQQPSLRHRFESNNLDTASPARVLTMCFDRLDRDLGLAHQAITDDEPQSAHDALTHAQDLLSELAGMLDTNGWEHAGALLAVYDYLLRLLARANMLKQAPLVAEAQRLITEIGGAFRTAASTPTASAPASPAQSPSRPAAAGAFANPATARPAPSAESTLEPTPGWSMQA